MRQDRRAEYDVPPVCNGRLDLVYSVQPRPRPAAVDWDDAALGVVERDRILALKQKMLAEAYKRAAEKLNDLSDDEKLSLYRKWLLKYGEDSDYSVVMNKKDRDSFGDILASEMSRGIFPGHPSLSAFSADITGGLILDFGDSRTDVSFESVVNSEKGRYDMELINIMFSEGQN